MSSIITMTGSDSITDWAGCSSCTSVSTATSTWTSSEADADSQASVSYIFKKKNMKWFQFDINTLVVIQVTKNNSSIIQLKLASLYTFIFKNQLFTSTRVQLENAHTIYWKRKTIVVGNEILKIATKDRTASLELHVFKIHEECEVSY